MQQLSASKVVNRIKITVLNPDLTAPDLDPFSSVILEGDAAERDTGTAAADESAAGDRERECDKLESLPGACIAEVANNSCITWVGWSSLTILLIILL